MEKLTISATELPRVLGVGRNTAYELVKRTDFPAVRIGRRIVIPVDALRAWLERQTVENDEGIR
ncbi:MAG: helix-turn-helix domain-containing protein [Clostridia bacterium]|nr:helix-turn-helix domain-containing protein [Clostridia bacterium]